jgi:hypothetical protein
MKGRLVHMVCAGSVSIGLALFFSVSARGQTAGSPEKFTATVVNMSNVGRSGMVGTVEIGVTRWSTEAEHEQMLSAVMDGGQQKLLDTLQKAPRVGYIRPLTSIGYDIHYARETALPDGGKHIVLATDRPMSFWEVTNQPPTVDYPLTIIELNVNNDGKGEGTISIATRVVADKEANTIVLQNYANQPLQLTSVREEKSGQ